METEGLDFTSALESLAAAVRRRAPEPRPRIPEAASRRQRRERLSSLLERAAVYYARYLWEASEAAPRARVPARARACARRRCASSGSGYAPSAWDRMLLASRRAGFSDDELLAVGLAQRSQSRPGQIYDRFRERIMFPLGERPRERARVRGAGDARQPAAQVPEHRRERPLPQARAAVRDQPGALAAAARPERMVLVEGYTDVLALHQAGLRQRGRDHGHLADRGAGRASSSGWRRTLELCLDADRAGQDAMLRAARLAAGRKLELRVVPLPEGTDPADLIARAGRRRAERAGRALGAVRGLPGRADPRPGRHLERRGTRPRAVASCGRCWPSCPQSVMREDLLRRIAGRLELSAALLSSLAADADHARGGGVPARNGAPANGGAPAGRPGDASRARRSWSLCVSLPADGEKLLSSIDPDALMTSEPYRRAARHLIGRVASPLADLPPDDEQLASLVADLVARSGRAGQVSADQLRHARARARARRGSSGAIRRARASGSAGIADLAREREQFREAIRATVARMERAG